ncbi:SOS response-associated peptidase [Sphingosinithalassobacter portus]|uniref:SOS response-associated peptidase n=1 Tax=Stakelama portus TaxID=2676234 RepID=UPI000D6E91B3|nr:SOS response-associated peptidase family protein [Sphingosinithalassobacter portus]
MCNHYQKHPEAIAAWADYIGWSLPDAFGETLDDVWPKGEGWVARIEDGEKRFEPMRWGFELHVPGKREGTTRKTQVTNIRNLSSPFWRGRVPRIERRCLVPFTRFAEPKIGQGREEHWFTVPSRPAAAFAGIWDMWNGEPVFAFLTCEPNSLVKPLHPKAMPVILAEDDYQLWLTGDWNEAQSLVAPFPAQLMRAE